MDLDRVFATIPFLSVVERRNQSNHQSEADLFDELRDIDYEAVDDHPAGLERGVVAHLRQCELPHLQRKR